MHTPFSAKDIRAKARETMSHTPSIYTLALIPAIVTLAAILFQQLSPALDYFQLQNMAAPELLALTFKQTAFPLVISILVGFFTLSILFAMKLVVDKKKERVHFTDALTIFNHPHFGKILSTYLAKGIRLFLLGVIVSLAVFSVSSILGMVAGFLLILVTGGNPAVLEQYGLLFIIILVAINIVTVVAGLALYLSQYYHYSLVELILYEKLDQDTYTNARTILQESRYLIQGYKKQRFILDLTFIGWYLLTLFSFGLAYIYTLPYYQTATIHFYNWLKENREQDGLR